MSDIPGINVANVCRFFAEKVPGADAELTFQLLAGGRSNVTYLVESGLRRWVIRRPPLGHVLPTAHDMAREYRVQAALADTNVPVPRPIALCMDATVNEQPFYVMEYRPGVVLNDSVPPGFATTSDERRRISEALVDTLVKLHAVDYAGVGLSDFGRPDGYLERQLRRWAQQWERSKTGELRVIDDLIRHLRNAIPTSPTPTIVHGDYRLGNMALDPADPGKVVAIFDWEMATLGDPLADLGYTLMYWGVSEGLGAVSMGAGARFTAEPGFFTRDELVQAYAKRSGRNVDAIDFYHVLALYKLAVIAEGIHARHLQGKTLGEGFEGTRAAPILAERALAVAAASSDARLR